MGILPEEVERIVRSALVAEFIVVDRRGRPITHPMLPLYDGSKLWFHSSILYSKKLRHIRANPKVAISISDARAVPVDPFHRVTIQGDARVIDDDVHRGWQPAVLQLWIDKEPIVKDFYSKRVALPLFWERALIEVTPRRAIFWENGRTDLPAKVFELEAVAS
jgi:general stress protein 26